MKIEAEQLIVQSHLLQDQLQGAARLLAQQSESLENSPLAALQSKHYKLQAELACKNENLKQEEQYLIKATDGIGQMNRNLFVDEFRLGFMDDKLATYQRLIEINHQQTDGQADRIEKLFFWLDSLHFAPVQPVKSQKNLMLSPEAQALEALKLKWNWHQNRIPNLYSLSPTTELDASSRTNQTALVELEKEIIEHQRRMRAGQNRPKQSANNPSNATSSQFASFQEKLQPSQLGVFFYIALNQCHVVLLSHNKVTIHKNIGPVKKIQRLFRSWQAYLKQRSLASFGHMNGRTNLYLQQFYAIFFAAIREEIDKFSDLFVVVPARWQGLPLASCYDGTDHLIQSHSFTFLSAPSRLVERQLGQLLALSQQTQAAIFGSSDNGRLPQVIAEGRQVEAVLSPVMPTALYLEDEATTAQLKSVSQSAAVLHLAAHAEYRSDNPLFSWIRLADNPLTVSDFYDFDLSSCQLAILNVCDSGLGINRGGGNIGFVRSLQSAGVQNLVVSLWQLEDGESAELIHNFYSTFIQKPDPARALQTAQVSAIQAGKDPFYWAGHSLII